ncbi:hypothetical protein [Wolbachia endosymbiont of Pentidionis agamae]|uniref:hypothetical protein n=1 Tax=Wolbachia endosymbiont of Pentidionis agamae TaxID=3110435 RepID=UPI002FD66DA0
MSNVGHLWSEEKFKYLYNSFAQNIIPIRGSNFGDCFIFFPHHCYCGGRCDDDAALTMLVII